MWVKVFIQSWGMAGTRLAHKSTPMGNNDPFSYQPPIYYMQSKTIKFYHNNWLIPNLKTSGINDTCQFMDMDTR